MRKWIAGVFFCLVGTLSAQPYYMWVGAFTVQDYKAPFSDLTSPNNSGTAFLDASENVLKTTFTGSYKKQMHCTDSAVTDDTLLGAHTCDGEDRDDTDFFFWSGHGDTARLRLNDSWFDLKGAGIGQNEWTRWAYIYSCNIFKNSAGEAGGVPNEFQNVFAMGGLRAVVGFRSSAPDRAYVTAGGTDFWSNWNGGLHLADGLKDAFFDNIRSIAITYGLPANGWKIGCAEAGGAHGACDEPLLLANASAPTEGAGVHVYYEAEFSPTAADAYAFSINQP